MEVPHPIGTLFKLAVSKLRVKDVTSSLSDDPAPMQCVNISLTRKL